MGVKASMGFMTRLVVAVVYANFRIIPFHTVDILENLKTYKVYSI